MKQPLTVTLSRTASKRIDWQRIQDASVDLADRGPDAPAATAAPKESQPIPSSSRSSAEHTDRSREVAERIFATARQEFANALDSLRKLSKILIWIVGVTTAISLAGLILAVTIENLRNPGAVVSSGGLLSLLGFFGKLYRLGRDQAMLELVPTRYELAFHYAATEEDRRSVLNRFLEETQTLRAA